MIRALFHLFWQPCLMVIVCLMIAAVLSACTTTGAPLPPHLLTCADQPPAPTDGTQRDVGLYVIDLAAAGDDCRTKLGAIRGIVE